MLSFTRVSACTRVAASRESLGESAREKKKRAPRENETPASDEPNRRARAGEDGFRCAAFRGRGVRASSRASTPRPRVALCGAGKRRRPRTRTEYGELDETTFITVMAFVGLGVVFCALAALWVGGARPAWRASTRSSRRRGVCAGGRGWRLRRRLRRLAVGPLRGRRCRIVDSQGGPRRKHGVVTRADASATATACVGPAELSDTFTYRPVAGGPLLRARGGARARSAAGGARTSAAETHPADARGRTGGARDCLASPRGFPRLAPRRRRARVGGPVGGDVAHVGRSRRRCLVDDV